VTDPVGAVTQFQYDPAGNRVGLTNPNGRTTTYAYDAANRLTQVADAAGGKTTYAYDMENNLRSIIDARGHATSFTYDTHNRLATRVDPLGAAEMFTYDGNGNLLTRTDRKGQTLTFAYDPMNRPVLKALPDGSAVSYTYDAVGRLLTATDPNGTLAFTYDLLGRLLTATSQEGRTLAYSYDAAGNRVSLQDDTGHLTGYSYDHRNLLVAITDPRAGSFAFGYDVLGRRVRLSRPNRTTTTYAYDRASRLTGLTHTGPRGPFEALNYEYDPAGNRTADTRNRGDHQYAYDSLDQLVEVVEQMARGRGNRDEAYTYDPVGNRLSGPRSQAYQYDAANHLTQDSTHTYAYDANGNLIEKRRLTDGHVTTYTYDAEDRLIQVVTPRTEVSFQYDPLGRRTEKRVLRWEDEDGDQEPDPEEEGPSRVTRYLYDQEDILATSNDAGRELVRYTHGPGIDEPLAEVGRTNTRYYHADVLGSIIALSGPHGLPIRHYRYSAFGVPEDHKGDRQPYRFTGREWDKEARLHYYRTRYYDPTRGRFLQEDPIRFLGDSNFYSYVRNDPINSIDPAGEFALEGTAALVLIAGALGGTAIALQNPHFREAFAASLQSLLGLLANQQALDPTADQIATTFSRSGSEKGVGTHFQRIAEHLASLTGRPVGGFDPKGRDPRDFRKWRTEIQAFLENIRKANYSDKQLLRELKKYGFDDPQIQDIVNTLRELGFGDFFRLVCPL
jgi:RHS repeat-associated protein